MRASRIFGAKEALEVTIAGAAELAEDVVKLRLGKIAKLAGAILNRRASLLQDEANARGRELALIPETRLAFPPD
jgi:hypothetical protein